jgi:hypothetical protein
MDIWLVSERFGQGSIDFGSECFLRDDSQVFFTGYHPEDRNICPPATGAGL